VLAAREIVRGDEDLAPAPAVFIDRRHPENAHEWISPRRRSTDKPTAA
jgi:hypothetical protein